MARICTCQNEGHYEPSISFEDIELHTWGPMSCTKCGADRPDDTPEERLKVVVEEVARLRKMVRDLQADTYER